MAYIYVDENGNVHSKTGTYGAGGTFAEPAATSGDRAATVRNKPTHPKLATRSPLAAGHFAPVRGRIRQSWPDAFGTPIAGADSRAEFHFILNPTSINFSYEPDSSQLARSEREFNGELLRPSTSVSFQLFLDRTFEVLEEPETSQGLLEDLAVLEYIGQMRGEGDPSEHVSPAFAYAPVDILFGGPRSFSFNGYLSGMSLTLTHFTPDMVPLRGVLDVAAIRQTPLTGGNNFETAADGGTVLEGTDDVNPPAPKPAPPPAIATGWAPSPASSTSSSLGSSRFL